MNWIWITLTGAGMLALLVFTVLALVRKWMNAPSSDLNRIYDTTML